MPPETVSLAQYRPFFLLLEYDEYLDINSLCFHSPNKGIDPCYTRFTGYPEIMDKLVIVPYLLPDLFCPRRIRSWAWSKHRFASS